MTPALTSAPGDFRGANPPPDLAEILRMAFASLAPSDHLSRLLDHMEGRV